TIKNCIVQNFTNWGILDTNDALNTRVENCTIDGTGSHGTTGLGVGGGTNSAIIGCDIKGMAIAINMFGSALVKDNYIHDLNDTSSDPAARHFDGIRAMVSGADIEHNTIMMPDRDGGTAAVFINTELPDAPGPIDNVKVIDNLMTGDASYTVYVTRGEGAVTNVTVENNYVERGMYGYFNVSGTTPTIRNNVLWDNQKNPIPYPKR
uniref:right-handed parallel beta-helix repeat-containing protein n=1 Tax=Bradyrhizobium sp. WSM1743 TaxID=318996 RepID=UPI0004896D5B